MRPTEEEPFVKGEGGDARRGGGRKSQESSTREEHKKRPLHELGELR